jgi:hypothetical protein
MMNVEGLVMFAILMENGGGILDKSPHYILEKFQTCLTVRDVEMLRGILDTANRHKFDLWLQRWGADVP